MLGESDVYGSGSSIGVDCDGGQLTLSDMMAEKTMVATCRGTEVLGGAVRQDESSRGDGQLVVGQLTVGGGASRLRSGGDSDQH
jgi:hypothetical protein